MHKLETRRLARMNGDFDEDALSDISDDEGGTRKRGKKKEKKKRERGLNPEELSDSEDEEKGGDGREVRFTADGLVYVDKDGKVDGKVGNEQVDEQAEDGSEEEGDESEDDSQSGSEEESAGNDLGGSEDEASAAGDSEEGSEDDEVAAPIQLTKGMKVQGNYCASEQYGGKENWYNGTITAVRKDSNGRNVYDITYDDGDFEEDMVESNVRPLPKSKEEIDEDNAKLTEAAMAKKKKQKAKMRAKYVSCFNYYVVLLSLLLLVRSLFTCIAHKCDALR